MSEELIQNTKEQLYEWSKSIIVAEPEKVILRNGANSINQLQQKNQQLKEQNNRLKTRIKTIKRRRKKQSQKIRIYKEIITNIQNKLEQRDEVMDDVKKLLDMLDVKGDSK